MSLRSHYLVFCPESESNFPVNERTSSVRRVSVSFSSKIHFEKVGTKAFVGFSVSAVIEDCVKEFAGVDANIYFSNFDGSILYEDRFPLLFFFSKNLVYESLQPPLHTRNHPIAAPPPISQKIPPEADLNCE